MIKKENKTGIAFVIEDGLRERVSDMAEKMGITQNCLIRKMIDGYTGDGAGGNLVKVAYNIDTRQAERLEFLRSGAEKRRNMSVVMREVILSGLDFHKKGKGK